MKMISCNENGAELRVIGDVLLMGAFLLGDECDGKWNYEDELKLLLTLVIENTHETHS